MIDKLIEFFKNLFGAKKGGEITPPMRGTYMQAYRA